VRAVFLAEGEQLFALLNDPIVTPERKQMGIEKLHPETAAKPNSADAATASSSSSTENSAPCQRIVARRESTGVVPEKIAKCEVLSHFPD
jgi:hypothetical protein